jgi:hypothetical protein
MCFNLHTHIEIFVSIHIQSRSWVLEAMNKGKGFCVWELNSLTNLGCSQPQNCLKWSFRFPYKLGDITKELTHWNFRSCGNLIDRRKCVFDWFSLSLHKHAFTRSVFPPKQSFGEDYKLLKPTHRLGSTIATPWGWWLSSGKSRIGHFFVQDVSLYGVSLPHGCNLLKQVWSYGEGVPHTILNKCGNGK